MTAVEKRKIIEAIDTCVRGDLFTDSEVDRIMNVCYVAIGRAVREAEEAE